MKKIPETDIQKMLGDYHAPKGLYSITKDMPFLGKVSCNVESIVAGSWQEIVIDYELGASGMADGSWFKATFRFYSDWALFQTTEPSAANYVSAEYHAAPTIPGQSPATVQKLTVRFDQKGHERPFQKAIIVDTFDGYLKAGDHIVIRLGDRRFGGAGTRVQTFVEQNFKIRCYVDPLGTSRFAAVNPDLVIQIVPGVPAQLMWAGSRIVKAGEKLPLRLRAEDEIARAERYAAVFSVVTVQGSESTTMAQAGRALKHALREVDYAGDMGDYIAVVLPNTTREGAEVLAGRLAGERLVAVLRRARVDGGLIDEIVHAIDPDRLLFEAPQKAQQVWFIRKFGPNVNLGNIPPDEVIPLETLRLGLRADTLIDPTAVGNIDGAGI